MHKVHHHYSGAWKQDTNLCGNFSVWDRLFGTYFITPVYNLKYGLDVLEKSNNHIGTQFKIPVDNLCPLDY